MNVETPKVKVNIDVLFLHVDDGTSTVELDVDGVRRFTGKADDGYEWVVDDSVGEGAQVCYLRAEMVPDRRLSFSCPGQYRIEESPAGGWLLLPEQLNRSNYWIPGLPCCRSLDNHGHILSEFAVPFRNIEISESGLSTTLSSDMTGFLDVTIVRLTPKLCAQLQALTSLESRPYFMYASHGCYRKPSDVFTYLVHGHVYNGEYAWPTRWRIPDELEAYALYLALTGLETALGKEIYGALKRFLVIAVVSRQSADGGWYHGEWTDQMECHVRLHVGGIHLLATALEERDDPMVRGALSRAAEFSVGLRDETEIGTWFLHDSLEASEETMRLSPFRWISSRRYGKSSSNMLVLNTHLDTLIALDRYRRLTGDHRFDEKISSGLRAARAVLNWRPLEHFYGLVYRLIALTWLPIARARRLPIPVRAVKRIAWKHLIPNVYRLRSHFPRLVMPSGYIERSVNLAGASHRYQSVNIWDLVRYRRQFNEQGLEPIIDRALKFTREGGLLDYWSSIGSKGDALGFWVEALWHLSSTTPDAHFRQWLAEAMLLSHEAGFGIPPSVLGANTEAVAVLDRVPCPVPTDVRLLVANLGRRGHQEVVVANPYDEDIPLNWALQPPMNVTYQSSRGQIGTLDCTVPARGWVWGNSAVSLAVPLARTN